MYRLRSFLSALKPTRFGILFAVLIGFGVGFWQWGKPPKPRVVIENIGLLSGWYVFSRDGSTLAIVEGSFIAPAEVGQIGGTIFHSLSLWDVVNGHKKSDLLKDAMVWDAAFSPDGHMLACLSNQITIWNVANGQQLASYPWERFDSRLVFAADGKLLATVEDDLWDVADKRVVKKLVLEGEQVMGRGHSTLLVRTKSDTVKVWDLATAKICAELKASEFPEQWKTGLESRWELTPDLGYMIGQHWQNGSVLIFQLTKGEKQEISPDTFRGVTGAAISPDGKTIALGIERETEQTSWWNGVKDWLGLQGQTIVRVTFSAIPSGQEVISLKGCSNPLFSPDGRTLAVTGAVFSSLHLWDLPIRKPIGKILAHAALAALATLLTFNCLGWLRRRRAKQHALLIASGSAAQVPMAETK